MKEGFEKERAEAQNAFEQEKARIAKEEQERLQLYERLRKAGGKVTPGQKSTILAQAAAQRVQAARKLDHTLTEIDKKEEKADADHLENLLKPTRITLRSARMPSASTTRPSPRCEAI